MLLVGVMVASPAAVLLVLVANVLPLEQILPGSVRVTGPVRADARALFWIGFCLVAGFVAAGQGAHAIRYGTGSRRRLVVSLALGAAIVVAGVAAHLR